MRGAHVGHKDVSERADERVLLFVALAEGLAELPVALEDAAVDDLETYSQVLGEEMGRDGEAGAKDVVRFGLALLELAKHSDAGDGGLCVGGGDRGLTVAVVALAAEGMGGGDRVGPGREILVGTRRERDGGLFGRSGGGVAAIRGSGVVVRLFGR